MRILVLSIFLFAQVIGFAQINDANVFHTYTSENGLNSNTINSIIQDNNGIIWFASENGVASFNGYSFQSYFPIPNHRNSLPHHRTFDLEKDTLGNIWIATGNGLCLLDIKKMTFKTYNRDNGYTELQNTFVKNVEIDNNGAVWFSVNNAVCLLDQLKDTIYVYPLKSDKEVFIQKMKFDQSQHLWVSANNTLLKFNIANKTQTLVRAFSDNADNSTFEIVTAIELSQKTIWCGTNFGKIFTCNTLTNEYSPKTYINSTDRNVINNIFIESDNTIHFLIDKKGIYRYDIADGKGEFIKNKLFNLIDNRSVTFMYRDVHKNYWLSLHDIGIAYTAPNTSFQTIHSESGNTQILQSNKISSLHLVADDLLWVGTDGGGLYTLQNETVKKVAIEANSILSIDAGVKNDVWIGTYENGVFNYSSINNQLIESYTTKTKGLTSNDIRKTIIDKDGNVWFVTHGQGVACVNKSTKKIESFSLLNGLAGDWTYDIICDSNNNIWVASNDGLSKIDARTRKITNLRTIANANSCLINNFVYTLYIDSDNQLWCGTVEGFSVFDLNNQRFKKNEKSLKVSIHSIVEDKTGNIWMGSDRGLYKLDKKGAFIAEYSTKNGLMSNFFNRNAAIVDSAGTLYFGTTKGILKFNPDSIKKNMSPPILSLYDVEINHISQYDRGYKHHLVKEGALSYSLSDLRYDENNIAIVYNAIHFTDPEENKVAYRLLGMDTTWIVKKQEGEIFFNTLPEGTYIFQLKAANNDNIWTDDMVQIKFSIQPAWWNTWLFRLSILIATIIAVAFYFYYKMRAIRTENEKLERNVNLRTRELHEALQELNIEKKTVESQNNELIQLADALQEQNMALDKANKTQSRLFSIIAHDIRNPFSSVLGLGKILNVDYDKYDDTKRKSLISHIYDASETIFDHLSNMLDWARGQSESISYNPSHLMVSKECHEVIHLLQPLADKKQIVLSANIPQHLAIYADKNMFLAIMRNLVNNALKFTSDKGSVSIEAHKVENYSQVLIEIIDTGTGISTEDIEKILNQNYIHTSFGTANEPGTGLGISICQQFIKTNDGTFEIESEVGKGSRFKLTFPVGNIDSSTDEQILEEQHIISDTKKEIESEIVSFPSMKSKHILIVEDNMVILEHLQNELSRYFTVYCATNGSEALDMIEQKMPDIVLSDVAMPVMDGFTLCKHIKQSIQTSHIPVLLITAQRSDSDKFSGLELGANDYILKPYKISEILFKIKNIFDITEQLQKRFKLDEKDYSQYTSIDDTFLRKLTSLFDKQFSNPDLSVEHIGEQLGMSRSHLYKKCIALTGKTPTDILQELRMQHAIQLLRQTDIPISDVAYSVGYNDPRYFASRFKVFTGKTPSEMRAQKN